MKVSKKIERLLYSKRRMVLLEWLFFLIKTIPRNAYSIRLRFYVGNGLSLVRLKSYPALLAIERKKISIKTTISMEIIKT